jgi:outer membrane protein assembly factor BamB
VERRRTFVHCKKQVSQWEEVDGGRPRTRRGAAVGVVLLLVGAGAWLAWDGDRGDGTDRDGAAASDELVIESGDATDARDDVTRRRPGTDPGDVDDAGAPEHARAWGFHLSVLLSDGHGLTKVDMRDGARSRVTMPGMRGGDPPFVMTRRGEAVVFYGDGGDTFAFHPGAPQRTWRVGASDFYLPSGTPDRVWLVEIDEHDDGRRTHRVREVTVDGEVTVERAVTPAGWPIAAVADGLVLEQEGGLLVWDPRSGDDIVAFADARGAATVNDRLAWCAGDCVDLRVTDLRGGLDARFPPPDGAARWSIEHAEWSPNGGHLAVAFVRDEPQDPDLSSSGLAVVSVQSGEVTVVEDATGMRTPPLWSPDSLVVLAITGDGELVTHAVNGPTWRADTGLSRTWHGLAVVEESTAAGVIAGEEGPTGPRLEEPAGLVVSAGGFGSGVVRAADPGDAEVVWTRDFGASAFLGPRVADESADAALLVGVQGKLVALDAADGSTRWATALDEQGLPGPTSVDSGTAYVTIDIPAPPGDTQAPRVRAIDLGSGETRWETALSDGTSLQWAPPVVTDGAVLVVDTLGYPGDAPDSALHALDPATGDVLWRYSLGEAVHGSDLNAPLVDDDRVFVGTFAGDLHAVDVATGTEVWRHAFDGRPRPVAVLDNGRLVVRHRTGLLEFDPETNQARPLLE